MFLQSRTHLVRFGTFEFDLATGELWKAGRRLKLQNQPCQVLKALVSQPGELVTREELKRELWPDETFVDFDSGLNVAIRKIRHVLGDLAPSPRFIETERARGYRFIAPVTGPSDPTAEPQSEDEEFSNPVALEAQLVTRDIHKDAARHGEGIGRSAFAVLVLAITLIVPGDHSRMNRPASAGQVSYTQLTSFTDSAVAPVLSPDGRMVAFYRSDRWFLTPDQIWVKLLPSGDLIQLTDFPGRKYGLAFSPDGARIAFSLAPQPSWRTFTVSPFGGKPELMISNAAGLTWIDHDRLLFSEVRTGLHMGIVSSGGSHAERRPLYFPQHERAMAHYSHISPDRRWVLVVEMDHVPTWQPCRVVPFDGSSDGWIVGPSGSCTAAAWSREGEWMYFSAEVDGSSHLWRQRFPRGEPEQITFGPNQELGVALFPDGRSLVTSVGIYESAVWMSGSGGERPLTSEGYVSVDRSSSVLSFSGDGKYIYFLLRRDSLASASELWRVEVETSRRERVLSGFSIVEFDIDADDRQVVFWTQPRQPQPGQSHVWLAQLDGSAAPRRIGLDGDASPHFGPQGEIVFRLTDGQANYLAVMGSDGSRRRKTAPYPIATLQTVSPDGSWAVALVPSPDAPGSAVGSAAIPIAGGEPRQICAAMCDVRWSPDGRLLYVTILERTLTDAGRTIMIPLPPDEMLPTIPEGGVKGVADAAHFPGARVIEAGGPLAPGPDARMYAFVKSTMHRNLFRITLPAP